MRFKKIFKNEKAVAGSIFFLLVIAFFAVILSYVQVRHVPLILENKEVSHMEKVSNQLSRLKAFIDIQSKGDSDAPITSVLTLGSRGISYWFSTNSYGEIQVIDEKETDYFISIKNEEGTTIINLTSIIYNAYNSQFVDQRYVLECGGIILKQEREKSIMMIDPNINATFDQFNERIVFYMDIPVFISRNNKNNAYGIDNCFIKTNYSFISNDNWNLVNSFNYFNISTNYGNAWHNFLDISFNKIVRDNITLSETSYGVSLKEKENSNIELDLYYRLSYIYVEIE